MDCDEPHLAPNEKMHPIQWTERPTDAFGGCWFTLPPMLVLGTFTFLRESGDMKHKKC